MLPEGLLPEGLLKEFDLEIPDCQLIDAIEQGVRQREDRQASTPTSLLSAGGWGGPPGPEFRAMLTQPSAVSPQLPVALPPPTGMGPHHLVVPQYAVPQYAVPPHITAVPPQPTVVPQSPALNPRAKTFIPITSGDSPRENNAPTPSFPNPERWGGPPQPTAVSPCAVPPYAVSLQPPLIGGLPGFESWIKNSLDELHKCILPVLRSHLDEMKLQHPKTKEFLNQYSDNFNSISLYLKKFKPRQSEHKRTPAVNNLILQIDLMEKKERDVTFRKYLKDCEDTWSLQNNREWKEVKRKISRFFQEIYIINTLKASFKHLDFQKNDNMALLKAVCKNLIDRSSDAGECSYTRKQKPKIPNNSIPMRLINAILQYEVKLLSLESASIVTRAEKLIRKSMLQSALLTLDPSLTIPILGKVLESSGFQYPEQVQPPTRRAPSSRLFPPRIDVQDLLSKIDFEKQQITLNPELRAALLVDSTEQTRLDIQRYLIPHVTLDDPEKSHWLPLGDKFYKIINQIADFFILVNKHIGSEDSHAKKTLRDNVAHGFQCLYDESLTEYDKIDEEGLSTGDTSLPHNVGPKIKRMLDRCPGCSNSPYLGEFKKTYFFEADPSHAPSTMLCEDRMTARKSF